MRKLLFLILSLSTWFITSSLGQSSPHKRLSSGEEIDQTSTSLSNLKYENIGPTVFSGRVTDIAVDPTDPTHFYVAYASGGLWETSNNGTTFDPIFDTEAVITIGDIAVNWVTGEIWVGTGEVNSSRSSYAGVGIYKSSDNGKSWMHLGLTESHHIGRIILHPNDPNIAWVGVLGHLYSYNSERGVYKTVDGGKTWVKTLFINDQSGIVDLLLDPNDVNTLYAASWQRERKAWDFIESGAGSGIHKSIDGGSSWIKITGGSTHFPDGVGVGRIGLSISSQGGDTRIYALLDNYDRRAPKEEDDADNDLVKEDFKTMSAQGLQDLSDKALDKYLKSNGFSKEYDAAKIKEMLSEDKIVPQDLATYLESANALLFDTPVKGAELYRSDDKGQTWQKTHDDYLDGVYYSYGYYFGVISSDPNKKDDVYIAGVPILRSQDGGATFKSINGDNVHVDHHVIWVNPNNPRHIINGNDGGINISYDRGDSWIKCNSPSVGQFYYINVDHESPYNVYGGTQDNGVWKGSHRYREGVRWHNTGKYPYQSIMGGDGMQVQIDPRDHNVVYTGFQFGNYFRITNSKRKRITPRHKLGDRPHRWNWQAPIHLSIHQPDILYMGAHVLFRSFDQGDHFTAISEDLTQGGKKGDVPYGTLSAIHESPLTFGLLYTGSDDGLIHISNDGGHSWQQISDDLPQDLWVSRVQASSHEASRVYASLNGYRNDDFSPYLYVSEDYGQTWRDIATALPQEPINVIKEDPHHDNILYVGTDRGVYISIDMGLTFERTAKHMPNVPVHDIVVQPEAKDLLVGTHGRSIYRADLEIIYSHISDLEAELVITDLSSIRYSERWGDRRNSYSDYNEAEQKIAVFAAAKGAAQLEVVHKSSSAILYAKEVQLEKGINYIEYALTIDEEKLTEELADLDQDNPVKRAKNGKYYLPPGTHELSIRQGEHKATTKLEIKKP